MSSVSFAQVTDVVTAAGAPVTDDGYDGTLASMGCSSHDFSGSAITEDPFLLCRAEGIDAIIDDDGHLHLISGDPATPHHNGLFPKGEFDYVIEVKE